VRPMVADVRSRGWREARANCRGAAAADRHLWEMARGSPAGAGQLDQSGCRGRGGVGDGVSSPPQAMGARGRHGSGKRLLDSCFCRDSRGSREQQPH
jgi:hypothetical protein